MEVCAFQKIGICVWRLLGVDLFQSNFTPFLLEPTKMRGYRDRAQIIHSLSPLIAKMYAIRLVVAAEMLDYYTCTTFIS